MALASAFVIGCGPDDDDSDAPAKGGTAEHAYALVTLIWSDDGPTGYVLVTDDLDKQDGSLETAHEFPGYTSVAVADGQLLVSPSWEDLTLERYRIGDQLDWQANDTVSFANEGVETASFHTQYMQDRNTAYLDVEVTGRVIWDPIGLEISGARTDEVVALERDGLNLFANWNRTQFGTAEVVDRA